MSCSTSSRRADREKIRGTSRRSDEDCADGAWAAAEGVGTVSVMAVVPPPLDPSQSYARGNPRRSGRYARLRPRLERTVVARLDARLVLAQERVERCGDE